MATLDPRLRERRSVYLLGIALFGGLAAACAYHFASGLLGDEVLCLPMKRRTACLRQFPLYYSRADGAARYGAELLRWLWLALAFATFTWFGASQLVWAGGVFGSPDERLARRIARHRRHIDDAIFSKLARVAPLHWRVARLELEWVTRQGEGRLRHSVADPEGAGSAVQLPEGLYRATGELLDLFQKHGKTFRKSVYSLAPGPGGRWQRTLVVE